MTIETVNTGVDNQPVGVDRIGEVNVQAVKVLLGDDNVDGGFVHDGNPLPVAGPLTDAQLRAAAVQVSGPLTDTQLRATPVAVSGPLTDAALRAAPVEIAGAVTISDGSGPVTVDGTVSVGNFPASQAVTGPLTDAELRATPVPVSGPLTNAQLRAEPLPVLADFGASETLLRQLVQSAVSPAGFDRSLGRGRVTAVLESGTVTTVTTVTTVAAVTTVTGLTNIDGRNGAMLINQTNLSAWADCVRARIT